MISTLSIKLAPPENLSLSQHSSSLFHGVLMEHLAPEVATVLHEKSLRPYRQGISVGSDGLFWHITTLTKEAKEDIMPPLLSASSIFLKHHQKEVQFLSKTTADITYDDLIQKTYLSSCPREISLQFLSPTSFKQGGEYVIQPSIRLILQSAMRKFDQFSSETEIFSEELLEDLEKHCVLSRYSLHSTRYPMENSKIPAFQGKVGYYIKGPQSLVNVVHLLCHYGQYAGVGIKSALGMGEIKVERKKL